MNETITIHKTSVLPHKLTDECAKIYNMCLKEDNNIPEFFLSDCENNSLPILYYATFNQQIVGFISVDCFENLYAELCGFILPDFRNKKIFSALFDAFLEDYDEYHISVSLREKSQTGIDIISHLGFEYISTEYYMECDLAKHDFQKLPSSIKEEYIDFGQKFCLYQDSLLIGSCIAEPVSSSTICIHDVYVDESFRRKGYGLQIMRAVLSSVNKKYNHAILHVTKENFIAVALYQKLGFIITDSVLVYEI